MMIGVKLIRYQVLYHEGDKRNCIFYLSIYLFLLFYFAFLPFFIIFFRLIWLASSKKPSISASISTMANPIPATTQFLLFSFLLPFYRPFFLSFFLSLFHPNVNSIRHRVLLMLRLPQMMKRLFLLCFKIWSLAIWIFHLINKSLDLLCS